MNRIILIITVCAISVAAVTRSAAWNENYAELQAHFERVTGEQYQALFSELKTLDQWKAERSRIQAGIIFQERTVRTLNLTHSSDATSTMKMRYKYKKYSILQILS